MAEKTDSGVAESSLVVWKMDIDSSEIQTALGDPPPSRHNLPQSAFLG